MNCLLGFIVEYSLFHLYIYENNVKFIYVNVDCFKQILPVWFLFSTYI